MGRYVKIILLKEFREILRDKITFIMLLIEIASIPVLMFSMGYIYKNNIEKMKVILLENQYSNKNEFENFLNCHEKINNYWNHPIPKSNSEKEAFVELLTFLGENTFSYFSQITFRKIQEQKLLDIVNKEILNYIDNKTKERLSSFK